MTERAAILRAIDSRTASGPMQQFFLRVARDDEGTLKLTLCDGCATWGGTVHDDGLTPPKMGIQHAEFAERLLGGLQGVAGTEADVFDVAVLPDDRRLLSWRATRQGKLVDGQLKQEMRLAPELPARPGAGLMELLLQLAHESATLQCECRDEAARAQSMTVRAASRCPLAKLRPQPRKPHLLLPHPLWQEEGVQLGTVEAKLVGAPEWIHRG